MQKSLVWRGFMVLRQDGIVVFSKKTMRFFAHDFFITVWIKDVLGLISVLGFILAGGRARLKKIEETPEALFDFVSSRFFGYFKPAQVRAEFLALLKIFSQHSPKTILEIGTFKGGTLFCFAHMASSDATIVSLDLPGGAFGGGYSKMRTLLYFFLFKKPGQKMVFLRMNSHASETLRAVRSAFAEKSVEFLFIDGDHLYEGAKKDFEMYGSLVSAGGVIAFHDIAKHPIETHCDVDRLWEEIDGADFLKTSIIESQDQGWGGIGVLKK